MARKLWYSARGVSSLRTKNWLACRIRGNIAVSFHIELNFRPVSAGAVPVCDYPGYERWGRGQLATVLGREHGRAEPRQGPHHVPILWGLNLGRQGILLGLLLNRAKGPLNLVPSSMLCPYPLCPSSAVSLVSSALLPLSLSPGRPYSLVTKYLSIACTRSKRSILSQGPLEIQETQRRMFVPASSPEHRDPIVMLVDSLSSLVR